MLMASSEASGASPENTHIIDHCARPMMARKQRINSGARERKTDVVHHRSFSAEFSPGFGIMVNQQLFIIIYNSPSELNRN